MPNDKLIQQEKAAKLKKEMIGKKYKHFKGSIYQVDTIAIHSETNELRVIYHSVDNPDSVWDRNLDMFLSPVDTNKYPDVKQELRFEPIKEDKILSQDIALAIKSSNGCYYTGFNFTLNIISMDALETTKVINNDTKFKMKSWMFELTGDWNVFLFEDESLIKAYKATIDEYEKTKEHLHIPSPPFDLEEIWN